MPFIVFFFLINEEIKDKFVKYEGKNTFPSQTKVKCMMYFYIYAKLSSILKMKVMLFAIINRPKRN